MEDGMSDYPMGAKVTYADDTATVSDGVAGLVTGRINGEPICDDDDEVIFVPVWSERDKRREPTTVFVSVNNIMEVAPRV
jgi:hypothetical protein